MTAAAAAVRGARGGERIPPGWSTFLIWQVPIGDRIKGADNGGGFDHNYVLRSPTNADGLRPAARVFDPESGRSMTVHTDQKGKERSYVLMHTTGTSTYFLRCSVLQRQFPEWGAGAREADVPAPRGAVPRDAGAPLASYGSCLRHATYLPYLAGVPRLGQPRALPVDRAAPRAGAPNPSPQSTHVSSIARHPPAHLLACEYASIITVLSRLAQTYTHTTVHEFGASGMPPRGPF